MPQPDRMILTADEIRQLSDDGAGRDFGRTAPGRRDLLLRHIPPEFKHSLPGRAPQREQVCSDLTELNRHPEHLEAYLIEAAWNVPIEPWPNTLEVVRDRRRRQRAARTTRKGMHQTDHGNAARGAPDESPSKLAIAQQLLLSILQAIGRKDVGQWWASRKPRRRKHDEESDEGR